MNNRREFIRNTIVSGAGTFASMSLLKIASADVSASDTLTPQPGNNAHVQVSTIAPPETIDWHNHWFSPQAVEILKKRTSAPYIKADQDGKLAFIGTLPRALPLAPEFTDVKLRLKNLHQSGVSRQIISWPTTLGADALLSASDVEPLWTAYNDDLADLVRKHPDKFSGLAVLPTSDIDWAAKELERAHSHLGLIGAVLPVGAFQSADSLKILAPVFDVAQKYHSHIYLHTGPATASLPGQWTPNSATDDAPAIRGTLETGSTFAQSAAVLSQSTFLDSYPNVTVQIAMLGGLASFIAGPSQQGQFGGRSNVPISRSSRIFYDTGVYGRAPHVVNFAVNKLGASQVLFGTDFPLAPIQKTVESVNEAGLSSEQLNSIYVANGLDLFKKAGIVSS